MVNPYALSSRQTSKPQIQLGQSQGLKKFEKFQAKQQQTNERQTSSKKKKKSFSLDSSNSNDSDEDEDEDEDSLLKNVKKNANKFMKNKKEDIKKPEPKARKTSLKQENDEEDENDDTNDSNKSDLEISVIDRSSTPNKKSSIQKSSSRVLSGASSVSSFQNLPKRSPSRVKFLKQDSTITDESDKNDDSTITEDLLNKNLLLDINDLEPAIQTSSFDQATTKFSKNKHVNRKISKSPLSKRSESVASIIEEDYSSITPSAASPSILDANLILDIKELEKNISQVSLKSEKSSSKRNNKKKIKELKKEKKRSNKKRSKSPTSQIDTETDFNKTIDSSIATELDNSERANKPIKRSEMDDSDETHSSVSNNLKNKHKSYHDDFETDLSQTSRLDTMSKKYFKTKTKNSIEVQVDPNDLLKNSDLIRSVNAYNPSSLLLASVNYLNDTTTLRDLNQLTGYNLINQTFNDLIRMNVNFMKNFLQTQRSLYEQQIQSIQPK